MLRLAQTTTKTRRFVIAFAHMAYDIIYYVIPNGAENADVQRKGLKIGQP